MEIMVAKARTTRVSLRSFLLLQAYIGIHCLLEKQMWSLCLATLGQRDCPIWTVMALGLGLSAHRDMISVMALSVL